MSLRNEGFKAVKVEGTGMNGRKFHRVFAGAVFVPAGTEHTERFEVAAWYRHSVTTEDRWYPVWATKNHLWPYDWKLAAYVESVVDDAYTPALWGGVPVGNAPQGKNHREVGQKTGFWYSVRKNHAGDGTFIPVSGAWASVERLHVHDFGPHAREHGEVEPTFHSPAWIPAYGEASLERLPVLDGYEWSYSTLRDKEVVEA